MLPSSCWRGGSHPRLRASLGVAVGRWGARRRLCAAGSLGDFCLMGGPRLRCVSLRATVPASPARGVVVGVWVARGAARRPQQVDEFLEAVRRGQLNCKSEKDLLKEAYGSTLPNHQPTHNPRARHLRQSSDPEAQKRLDEISLVVSQELYTLWTSFTAVRPLAPVRKPTRRSGDAPSSVFENGVIEPLSPSGPASCLTRLLEAKVPSRLHPASSRAQGLDLRRRVHNRW